MDVNNIPAHVYKVFLDKKYFFIVDWSANDELPLMQVLWDWVFILSVTFVFR